MRFTKLIQICAVALMASSAAAVDLKPAIEKSQVIVFINGQKFYVHNVKAGDTLYSIAKSYDVSEDVIRQNNPKVADGLKVDQTLKIPVKTQAKEVKKRKKDFIIHKINAGETLYSIARKYEISVPTLLEDNPTVDPQALAIGQSLWVRRADMGEASEVETQQEMTEYTENLNKVSSEEYLLHVVKPGETIYSLTRKYGISEQEFTSLNDMSAGLKAGVVVRIPNQNTDVADAQAEGDSAEGATVRKVGENLVFQALTSDQELNIALMLPLSVGDKPNASYVEFYQGFLLGLEDLKKSQRGTTKLTLYNTAHDSIRIDNIVKSQLFEGTNLIIGPVYEDELKPVVAYAESNSVPVVSPLANINDVQSSTLFQLAPDPAHKYDKIGDLIDNSRQICLIYAESNDTEFEREILAQLEGKSYLAYTYSFDKESIFTPRNAATKPLEENIEILDTDQEITFIVFANRETDVDRILGTLGSAKNSNTERSIKCAKYKVLGSSRWSRFGNIDQTTFFNNDVVMISTYHAKRDKAVVRNFDSRYIKSYRTLPSLYAYRGYDTAIIFGGGMRSDIQYNMLDKRYVPLQTEYKFLQEAEGQKYVNGQWMRVNYNNDHTITLQ